MVHSIAVAMLLSVITFTQSSGPQLSAIPDGETAFYSGKINEIFEIALSMSRSGGSISGSYQYATQDKPLDLQGSVLPNGKLKIAEYAAPGVVSGEFLLAAVPGQTELTGEWHSADGERFYAVHLQRIDADRYREFLTQWRATRELKSKRTSSKQKALLDRLTSGDPSDQKTRSDAVQEAPPLRTLHLGYQ